MYNYYINLKSAFRGYKKSQVDQYIREQLFQNFTTLSELSIKVIQLEGEKKQLEMTSLKLKNDLTAYIDENLSANLLIQHFKTLNKHKQTIQPPKVIINKIAEDTALAKKVDNFVDIIKNELETLSGKVDALSSIIDHMPIVQSNNSVIAPREAVAEEDLPLLQLLPPLQSMQTFPHAEDNIAEEQTAATIDNRKVEEVDFQREAAHSKKQDNAVHKSEKGKILNFTRISPSLIPVVTGNGEQKEQTNSYWGLAVNGYPKTDISSLIINTRELFESTDANCDFTRSNSFFNNVRISSANTEPAIKKKIKSDVESEKTETSSSTQSNTLNKPVLSEDAKYIRQKYIIGKIAGEDLYDRNGKLIIGRKSQITPQVVDYADKEGKLPELIINMVLRDTE